MKTVTRILAAWGCIVTIPFLYLLVVYLDNEGIIEFRRSGGVDYYYPADLQAMELPGWTPTNAIPLSPDTAVRTAMRYASEKHPGTASWDIARISLEKHGSEVWIYDIDMVDRQSGNYAVETARVLLDGTVWKPTKERRSKGVLPAGPD